MIIDLLIGMSVLGIVSFFAWSIGYSKGLKDCKKVDDKILDELFNKDKQL